MVYYNLDSKSIVTNMNQWNQIQKNRISFIPNNRHSWHTFDVPRASVRALILGHQASMHAKRVGKTGSYRLWSVCNWHSLPSKCVNNDKNGGKTNRHWQTITTSVFQLALGVCNMCQSVEPSQCHIKKWCHTKNGIVMLVTNAHWL